MKKTKKASKGKGLIPRSECRKNLPWSHCNPVKAIGMMVQGFLAKR